MSIFDKSPNHYHFMDGDLFCVFRDFFQGHFLTFSDLHAHDPEKITKS